MMKHLFNSIVVLVFVFAIESCGKRCNDAGCTGTDVPLFGFRLSNNADKDLLTGAFKVYDTSQLRIKAKRINTSSLEDISRGFRFFSDSLAITSFTVNESYAVYYLELNGNLTDSFFFRNNKNSNACCDLSQFNFTQHNTTAVTPSKLPFLHVLIK